MKKILVENEAMVTKNRALVEIETEEINRSFGDGIVIIGTLTSNLATDKRVKKTDTAPFLGLSRPSGVSI